jgi:hypothetical protein
VYLVHARFATADRRSLPADAAALVASCAVPDERVEHVVLHQHDDGRPVLGMFLLAASLAEAERAAAAVCRRALTQRPELAGTVLLGCEAPLIPVDPDTGRLMPRTDQDTADPFRFP